MEVGWGGGCEEGGRTGVKVDHFMVLGFIMPSNGQWEKKVKKVEAG